MAINSNYDQEGFKWRPMLVLSMILHGVLFSAFFWAPGLNSSGLKMNEVVYEVNLADASKISQISGKTSTPSAQKSAAAPADSKQAKRISSSSSNKNAVNIAKRTVDKSKSKPKESQASSDQLLNRAISKIEKNVNTGKNADYLDNTIAALNKKVGSSGSGNTVGGASGSLAINKYKMEVETSINRQWTYPDALGKDYEAIVVLKIRRDGTVLETELVKPSGNKIFDESVLKAIEKASPLPPLPEGYKENYEEIEITFNPKDFE